MTTDYVTWSEIQAECDGYREGFVAIFRKYEGMETDERDKANRVVKVTVNSFARHAGIAEGTFYDWVQGALGAPRPPRDHSGAALRFARKLDAGGKADLVAQIMDENPEIAEMARASGPWVDPNERTRPRPPEVSTADRKAAGAAADNATEAIRRAIAHTRVTECVLALEEAAEALNNAVIENALRELDLREIDEAHDKYVLARHEAGFKVEAEL